MDPAQTNQPQQTNQNIKPEKNISDVLIEEGLLTPEQYKRLTEEASARGTTVEQLLLETNIINEEQYYEARAKLTGIPFVSVATLPFSPESLSFIPKNVAERFQVVPFSYDKAKLSISLAMADPLDFEAINFIQQKTGMTVVAFQSIPSEISEAIKNEYNIGLIGEVKEALKETEQISKIKTFDQESIAKVIKEAPIAKIVSTILEYAIKSRASDVHIEPQEDRVRVRYRIDGILYERLALPKAVQDAVISRIKILSDLKIDERRTPQDGRFNFKYLDQEVDLRVSVLPTTYGEKIVMRLLRKSGGVPTLTELGIRGTAQKELEAAISRPHGIIIVCGPTGSGKTTTLYAVLSRINTTKVNISTLEDPVEYQIPGSNQVQINPDVGLTFASGLRAFLRQDPNIILVGEIRDKETTDLAIQAALTGHLVFSTLHTSNASGALPRLIDMGAETFLLASTMTAIVGQRIARKICPDCKISYIPTQEVILEIKHVLGSLMPQGEIHLYKGNGCESCGQSGYLGRVGIYEVLTVTNQIAKMILERSDANSIEQEAKKEGMITIKEDGYLKALEGTTTIEEVLRVAQD
ncbi:MAG: type II/IV secretion system protein [Candidatus Levybacteria bacterium]|nr:type II/IV secretion system protein [Candidatus Levybacteria bacterium]MBP9815333.1 type II/IV secretion system protein [Candidatus Levybacteria bacterium]